MERNTAEHNRAAISFAVIEARAETRAVLGQIVDSLTSAEEIYTLANRSLGASNSPHREGFKAALAGAHR